MSTKPVASLGEHVIADPGHMLVVGQSSLKYRHCAEVMDRMVVDGWEVDVLDSREFWCGHFPDHASRSVCFASNPDESLRVLNNEQPGRRLVVVADLPALCDNHLLADACIRMLKTGMATGTTVLAVSRSFKIHTEMLSLFRYRLAVPPLSDMMLRQGFKLDARMLGAQRDDCWLLDLFDMSHRTVTF